MTTATHAKLPTQEQINKQFTHGEIHKSLAYYNKIRKKNGDYQFGDLTQQWYGNNPQWMADVGRYDPAAQQQIMGYIIGFLTSQPDPTPFTINWSSGPRSISNTADTIEIVGYLPPPTDAEKNT